jgi:hypothetical protein
MRTIENEAGKEWRDQELRKGDYKSDLSETEGGKTEGE